MYVYVYLYKYVCICVKTCECLHVCAFCVFARVYARVCVYKAYLYVCKQACMGIFLCLCECACLCTCTCACLFAFMYMCNGSLVYVLKLQLSWFAKMHRIVKITTLQLLRHIELRYIC